MEEARTGAHDVPVDSRASHLELQLEQVRLTLEQLRQTQGSLQEMEARLGDMTRECAEILDRWARNDEKHAAAVVELHGRLSEWNDVERRLLNESATRVHQFERSLQHEWNALRAKHEAPLQQLEAQSTRIAQTCVTAVGQALEGIDKAEARLAALEDSVRREMAQLASDVRSALAELRDHQALGSRQPWSLDNVVRLHNELRGDEPGGAATGMEFTPAAAATGTLGLAAAAAAAPQRSARLLESPRLETGAATPRAEASDDDPESRTVLARYWPVGALLLVLVVAGAYGFYLHDRLAVGLEDAASRAAAAERDAALSRAQARQEIEHVQRAADARLASAEQAASTAQRLAGLVAAPDARRFELTGAPGTPAVHVLWSRSQGIAASAASLPALPEGRGYQLWFLTRGRPASAGMLAPSAGQPVSAYFPWPLDLQRAVVGAMITVEPTTGSPRPSGGAWLVSRTAPPPSDAAPAAVSSGS